MKLEGVLENAKEREITREEALQLFRETGTYDKTLRLFQVASEVRDQEVGRIFKLHGYIASITPCTVNPLCKYCSRSSPSNISRTKLFNKESVLTLELIYTLLLFSLFGYYCPGYEGYNIGGDYIYIYNILYSKGIYANVNVIAPNSLIEKPVNDAIADYERLFETEIGITSRVKKIIEDYVLENAVNGVYRGEGKWKSAVMWWEK